MLNAKCKPFISNRVRKLWKKIPPEIVGSKSTNKFKNMFDKHSARQMSSINYHSGRRKNSVSFRNINLSINDKLYFIIIYLFIYIKFYLN